MKANTETQLYYSAFIALLEEEPFDLEKNHERYSQALALNFEPDKFSVKAFFKQFAIKGQQEKCGHHNFDALLVCCPNDKVLKELVFTWAHQANRHVSLWTHLINIGKTQLALKLLESAWDEFGADPMADMKDTLENRLERPDCTRDESDYLNHMLNDVDRALELYGPGLDREMRRNFAQHYDDICDATGLSSIGYGRN